jgi:hypothetical protein
MKGIYQHCGEKHLHRYLAENDFRYNNRVALGVRLPNYWRWISCAGGENATTRKNLGESASYLSSEALLRLVRKRLAT